MVARGRVGAGLLVLGSVLVASCASSATRSAGTTAQGTVAPTTTGSGGVTTGGAPTTAAAPNRAPCPTTKLVVGLDTDPVQIDPQQLPQTLGAYTVIDSVYDTLATYVDGKPTPRLATSWTESADRLTWTVKIRQGVTFDDGTPLTADVVKQNLNAQRASTSNGPALANLSFLDAPDAQTLTVKLKTPWSAFPGVLTQFYTSVVAPSALRGSDLARKPVGTGPFTLTEWRPNDRIVLTCNDGYWGDKPAVGTIELRFVPDETARLAALRAGDIDAAWLLLKDSIESAQADKKLKTYRGPYAGQSITLFNSSAPPLDDVRLRTALVKAVDRKTLDDAYATPGSEDAFGPFPKGHPWYTETAYPTFDAAGARALVAAWSADNGGKKPSVTYSYTSSGNQLLDDLVAAIQQYWKAAGFDVKIDKQADVTGFVTQVVLGNYQAAGFVAGLDPDPDLTLYNGLHQLGAFNFERFKSAPLSDLLDKGRQAATEADRRAAYAAALQIVAEQVPVAYGSFSGSWISVTSRVTGMEKFKTFVFPTRLVGVTG